MFIAFPSILLMSWHVSFDRKLLANRSSCISSGFTHTVPIACCLFNKAAAATETFQVLPFQKQVDSGNVTVCISEEVMAWLLTLYGSLNFCAVINFVTSLVVLS